MNVLAYLVLLLQLAWPAAFSICNSTNPAAMGDIYIKNIPEDTYWPKKLKRTSYELFAELDYQNQKVHVTQSVDYINRSKDYLDHLLFIVEPNRVEDAFHLNRLNWENGEPIADYVLTSGTLRIPLPQRLPPNGRVKILLSYNLDVPKRQAPFGYTDLQLNLGDWYPFLPPYSSVSGWLYNEPAAVGEHLTYDVANYRVNVLLTGNDTNLVLAAGAQAMNDGNLYCFSSSNMRNFALSASPYYTPVSIVVDNVTVLSYAFPDQSRAPKAALTTASQALILFNRLFGSYQNRMLAVVEADFFDGMEYDGIFFLDKDYYSAYNDGPGNYLVALVAHETAHQWWYGLVGNDQAHEPFLDESLATYSELLFYEQYYPSWTDWWWNFRVQRFDPTGKVNSAIYEYSDFRSYINAVYLRGALFWHDVRQIMGDQIFIAMLAEYVDLYNHKQADSGDLFLLFEKYISDDSLIILQKYMSNYQQLDFESKCAFYAVFDGILPEKTRLIEERQKN